LIKLLADVTFPRAGKKADPDIPILIAANAEYAKLK
jgi:hypothetical protein